MKKILIVNASPRQKRSHSRALTRLFEETWRGLYPEDVFIHREVGAVQIPSITEHWIAAAFTRVEDRTDENQKPLAFSNELVQELKAAAIIVVGTPMYNWGIPSGLKAYIDQVMRINETWTFKSGMPDGHYVGLLKQKQVYILSSRGDDGYETGQSNAHMNFQTNYLQLIFNIMGVEQIEIISLNNEEYGGARFEKSRQEIYHRIRFIQRPV